MIENALVVAVESLIFSGRVSDVFSGCPIEITKVLSFVFMMFVVHCLEFIQCLAVLRHLTCLKKLLVSFESVTIYIA